LSAEKILGIDPAAVHALHPPAAHAYDATVFDSNIKAIAVGVQSSR
jgi:hypothetical protein